MTFRKKVFVSQKITLLVDGRQVRIQALVSPFGAKYVFEEAELPAAIRNFPNHEFEILYKNIPVKCRLIREITGAGVIYSFRFVNPSGLVVRQIERDIRENGLPSPWLRSLPRLSTAAKHLPVPVLAILSHEGETLFLNVKNFTLGGLQLEFVGSALNDLGFGDRLDFDLVTNSGDKISDMSAIVCHLSTEIEGIEGGQARKFFGVRFLPMSSMAEFKYKSLIKDHCVGLKDVQV